MRLFQTVAVEQSANRGGAKQGRVAVEDEQVPRKVAEQRCSPQDGVARAQELVLDDVVVPLAQARPHLVLAMADDDVDVLGLEQLSGVLDHVVEDDPVAQGLEHHRLAPGVIDLSPAARMTACNSLLVGRGVPVITSPYCAPPARASRAG